MDLSIIIISFNVSLLLKKCLKSIEQEVKNTRKLKVEVFVVDNASTDESVQMVRKGFPWIKLIENEENFGFARAANQGIKKAEGKYILLLNPDTIVKTDALERMVSFADSHFQVGVVGGRFIDSDNKIQGSCYRLPTLSRAFRQIFTGDEKISQKYTPEGNKPVEVEAVVGGVFLVPRKVFDEVGLMNERYFMYFEDLDFCRRAIAAGFKVYYLPTAEFIHYHGASGRNIPIQTHQWLVQSSKIYHGILKYWLITLIFWLGQKWQKVFLRK